MNSSFVAHNRDMLININFVYIVLVQELVAFALHSHKEYLGSVVTPIGLHLSCLGFEPGSVQGDFFERGLTVTLTVNSRSIVNFVIGKLRVNYADKKL